MAVIHVVLVLSLNLGCILHCIQVYDLPVLGSALD